MSILDYNSKYKLIKKVVYSLKKLLMKDFKSFYIHPPIISEFSVVIEFETYGYDDSLRLYLIDMFDGVEIRIDNLVSYYKVIINKFE